MLGTSPTKNLIDNRLPLSPPCVPCAPHACHLWRPYGFYNDAARRVATVFVKWNRLIEISLPVRRTSYKRLPPCGPFAAVPLLEYGGLKPILPFFEGRSDAACRVVIWPSCLRLWRSMVFTTPQRAASLSSYSPFPLMPTWAQMVVGTAYPATISPPCRL